MIVVINVRFLEVASRAAAAAAAAAVVQTHSWAMNYVQHYSTV